jgi:hypothetical protein
MVPIRIRSFRRGNSIVKAFSRSKRKGKLSSEYDPLNKNKIEARSPRFRPDKKTLNKRLLNNRKSYLDNILNAKGIINNPEGRASLGLSIDRPQKVTVALKWSRKKAAREIDSYIEKGNIDPDILALKKQKLRLAKMSDAEAYRTANNIRKEWVKNDLLDNY